MTANVLLVDDLEANLKLLEAKLLSEYYTVFSVNSGEKALEMLRQNKIDVILLDVMMPGMDGFETCLKIKSNPETLHIPVVMVTALSDIEDRIRGLEAGADEFLTKPINDTALFARVKSLSRMKSVIDELTLRNQTNAELGASTIAQRNDFTDSEILLINDDVVQTKNLKKMLKHISPKIKTISSFNEISNLEHYVPDIIIISCQLENEDPLRISMMARSNELLHNTAIMLLAEEENINIVIKGMELGVNDYFIYPVEENELLARIKTQLSRKLYQDDIRNALETSVNLSIKDDLTGVFNRRYFDIHIKQMTKTAEENNKPLCLMMFDIDFFKMVNDTYGHQAGDHILQKFTKILKASFRVTDLVSRYGGEEFTVLLNDTNIDEAMQIAERVRSKMEQAEFILPDQKTPIRKTTSIGLTEYKPQDTIDMFIKRADQALYKAKESGRNCVVKIQ